MKSKSEIIKTTAKAPGVRQKVEKCQICQKGFGMLMKQHQCKRCLRPVCSDCGNFRAITYHYDTNQQHRMCKICYQEQVYLREQIQQNQLAFGSNSLITKRWLKYLFENQKQLTESQVDEEFNLLLKKAQRLNQNENLTEALTRIPSTYQELVEEFHYSQFELNYLMTKSLDEQEIIQALSDVVMCLLFYHPTLKFEKKIVEQALFLLYFNGTGATHLFMDFFYEEFIPDRYHQSANVPVEEEMEFLLEIAKKNYLVESADLVFLRKFFENYSSELLSRLLFNILNVTCMLFLIDLFLKFKDFYEVQKSLVMVCKLHLGAIKTRGLDQSYILRYILNNTQVQTLKENVSKEDRLKVQHVQKQRPSKSDDIFMQFNESRSQSLNVQRFPTINGEQSFNMLDTCLSILYNVALGQSIDEFQEKLLINLSFEQQRNFTIIRRRLLEEPKTPQTSDQVTARNQSLSIIKEEDYSHKPSIADKPSDSDSTPIDLGNMSSQQLQMLDLNRMNDDLILKIQELESQNQKLMNDREENKGKSVELSDEFKQKNQALEQEIDYLRKLCDEQKGKITQNEIKQKSLFKQITDAELKLYEETKSKQQIIQEHNNKVSELEKIRENTNIQLQEQFKLEKQTIESKLMKDILDQKEMYEIKLVKTAEKQQEQILRIMKDFGMLAQESEQRKGSKSISGGNTKNSMM